MTTPMIDCEGLTKRFGGQTAIDRLMLQVNQGEIFGLVGPDGAGKTTTIRMLCGVMAPDEGEARVAGIDVRRDSDLLKYRISYMSQRFGLYGDLTVMENLRFYADLYEVPHREWEARVPRLLAFANLEPFRHRLADQLSGGMKQKLGLACALIHTPTVLFLDEPTNGVDPVSRRDFWQLLYMFLHEGVTIFLSTAYLDEAERCNRIGLLHEGRLLAYDTPERVKALLRDTVLELRCDQSRVARELLKPAPIFNDVVIAGDRLHLVVSADAGVEQGRAAVRERLEGAGIVIHRLEAVAPSLEDLFIELVRSRTGDGGSGRSGASPPDTKSTAASGEGAGHGAAGG
ncbi:MAG TPA: ABC transporter ATP-binding protein [Nitrospiria bacterium]|nr:ABC transporter ATP-binding protein [Nitrospiria bacterium]